MTRINIDLPVELHKRAKINAAIRGISLKELIIEQIDQYLENKEDEDSKGNEENNHKSNNHKSDNQETNISTNISSKISKRDEEERNER